MDFPSIIATIDVSLLLIAYLLNMLKFAGRSSYTYILMNLGGAGIACYASILIDFVPFIILEAFWALVSLGALMKNLISKGAVK